MCIYRKRGIYIFMIWKKKVFFTPDYSVIATTTVTLQNYIKCIAIDTYYITPKMESTTMNASINKYICLCVYGTHTI